MGLQHECLGQKFAILEEKVLVSTVLRNFIIKAAHSPEEAILEVSYQLLHRSGHHISHCNIILFR
jgi:cytochrome P450